MLARLFSTVILQLPVIYLSVKIVILAVTFKLLQKRPLILNPFRISLTLQMQFIAIGK